MKSVEVSSGDRDVDPLTGLLRRPAFIMAVDQAIASAAPFELPKLWVAVVAVPRLAHINAGFGVDAGDSVLRKVAALIAAELPEAFALGRLQGAELVVASFGASRRLTLRETTDPIRFLGVQVESAGAQLFANLRAGFATHAPGDDAAALLQKASLALIAAREGSGSDIERYSDTLRERARERIDIARELPRAIENDELTLNYQPKMDLRSGAMVGVEALVRWTRKDGSVVSPGIFVPAAEASGLIVPLGDWVLAEALHQAARWQADELPVFHVAINVSALQFQKTPIVERLSELLDTTGVSPERLELELTEGALADDVENVVQRLGRIRDLGLELAIDDFGTGYSSLSYLKNFPVHRIKIDQSFVRHLHENPQDRAVIRSVRALGHNLGLKVLAEGVETEAHVSFLVSEGCDEAQGYFYSRPLQAEALTDFARAHPPR